ncbi:hypothetical protein AVEN_237910-1 [Araneus ventricosus]|uniref:Uncharacterized protein n=1 Tax=Araneus ventricosus TaxID=182803 RepID=A0A4Y2FZ20_ARAVE|nr:hypothetical protein AVEN_237910-1 [Araneus ventricosus]
MALKNMKDGFAERFEQFKTNKSTFAFIVNPLNTNTNEINIEPFGIDAGSLQMQLLDLKTKDLWSGKFTELKSKLDKLEVQKCMHIAQHKWTTLKEIPRVEALIFGAWNSLPECYRYYSDLTPCLRRRGHGQEWVRAADHSTTQRQHSQGNRLDVLGTSDPELANQRLAVSRDKQLPVVIILFNITDLH